MGWPSWCTIVAAEWVLWKAGDAAVDVMDCAACPRIIISVGMRRDLNILALSNMLFERQIINLE